MFLTGVIMLVLACAIYAILKFYIFIRKKKLQKAYEET